MSPFSDGAFLFSSRCRLPAVSLALAVFILAGLTDGLDGCWLAASATLSWARYSTHRRQTHDGHASLCCPVALFSATVAKPPAVLSCPSVSPRCIYYCGQPPSHHEGFRGFRPSGWAGKHASILPDCHHYVCSQVPTHRSTDPPCISSFRAGELSASFSFSPQAETKTKPARTKLLKTPQISANPREPVIQVDNRRALLYYCSFTRFWYLPGLLIRGGTAGRGVKAFRQLVGGKYRLETKRGANYRIDLGTTNSVVAV